MPDSHKTPLLCAHNWDPAIQAGLEALIESTPCHTAESPETPSPVAVFDFDNTCIAGDIGEAVLIHIGNLEGTDLLQTYEQVCTEEGLRAGYPWCAEACGGRPVSDLRAISRQVIDECLRQNTIRPRPEIQDLIRVLSNQGWSVWIVSASLQQIVEEAAYLVGVPKSKVIGMRLASDGSSGLRLSQTAIPPLTLFEGKAQAISTLIGRTPTLAVGDSDTDYDMLAMSDHGLIIDRGQPRLREGAERYGWWIQLGWSTRALQ